MKMSSYIVLKMLVHGSWSLNPFVHGKIGMPQQGADMFFAAMGYLVQEKLSLGIELNILPTEYTGH